MALTPLNASETEDFGFSRTLKLFSLLFLPITPKSGILVAFITSLITLTLLSNNSEMSRINKGINKNPNKRIFLMKAILGEIGACPRFLALSITVISEVLVLSLSSASESFPKSVL